MDEIIKELAKKYNMTQGAIRAIIESPFRFIDNNIEKRTWENYNLDGLGKIVVKKRFGTKEECDKTFVEQQEARRLKNENRRNSRGLEEPNVGQSSSGEDSQE